MKILNLQTSDGDEQVRLSVSVESERLGKRELWFSTPKKFEDCLCKTRMDGFLVGLLFPAMQYGEDIHVAGCVSERLLFNLNNYVIPLLISFSPSCKRIEIAAEETGSERFFCKGVGTGFSGGVDSFCTIYDRFELEDSPDYRVNSFLFLNVGSHGWGESEEKQVLARSKFRKRYDYLKKFPDELGLDFISLDSNLHGFHPWGHQKTHTLTLAAGILLLQGHFRKYYCASPGWSYLELYQFYKTDIDKDVAIFDPIMLPLLSTESLELVADGTQYTRTEKTLRIAEYEPVKKYLNVCVSGEDSHENCSVCNKCCRTLMTLNSAGLRDEFNHLFDIEKYRKKAELRYASRQVLQEDKDPFARGNVELARQRGGKLPSIPGSYVVCAAYAMRRFFRRTAVGFAKAVLPEAMQLKIKGLTKL